MSAPEGDAEEACWARMAPVVSHELRNPLAIMGNSAYFVKTKLGQAGAVDPKVAKHLAIIDSEIKRANEVLGEILAFARMREAKPEPRSLNALVEDGLRLGSAPEGLALEKSLDPADPKVLADLELLKPAVWHLARNGLEAMALAGKGKLRLRTRSAEGFGVLEVSDEGPGVPPEVRPKLFTAFFTTRPRGVGLGLAYTLKAARRCGGGAGLAEGAGPGATFFLKLPTAP